MFSFPPSELSTQQWCPGAPAPVKRNTKTGKPADFMDRCSCPACLALAARRLQFQQIPTEFCHFDRFLQFLKQTQANSILAGFSWKTDLLSWHPGAIQVGLGQVQSPIWLSSNIFQRKIASRSIPTGKPARFGDFQVRMGYPGPVQGVHSHRKSSLFG